MAPPAADRGPLPELVDEPAGWGRRRGRQLAAFDAVEVLAAGVEEEELSLADDDPFDDPLDDDPFEEDPPSAEEDFRLSVR